jgi:hypothetical protein
MGIRIMDYRQQCPIGPSRAALRLAAYCVSSMTFEWGHLLMLIRQDRRTLQDILAGTRVVRKSRRKMRKMAAAANAEEEALEQEDGTESTSDDSSDGVGSHRNHEDTKDTKDQ